MSLFSGIKDFAVTNAMKGKVSDWIKPYGELKALEWNSDQKKLSLTALLNGESKEVTITLKGFKWHEDSSGKLAIEPEFAESSRAWLTTALQNYVVGKHFPVPSGVASILKQVL